MHNPFDPILPALLSYMYNRKISIFVTVMCETRMGAPFNPKGTAHFVSRSLARLKRHKRIDTQSVTSIQALFRKLAFPQYTTCTVFLFKSAGGLRQPLPQIELYWIFASLNHSGGFFCSWSLITDYFGAGSKIRFCVSLCVCVFLAFCV